MNENKNDVSCWYLEYTEGRSRKFYAVFAFEMGLCVLAWGRIGTNGQSSVTQYPSFDAAKDVALRQVYSKKAKGYVARYDGLSFKVSDSVLSHARSENISPLMQELNAALRNGRYSVLKDAVLTQYERLVEQARLLIEDQSDIEATLNAYGELEKAWVEICDKHAEVEIIMGLAQSMAAKRLMATP